MDDRLFEIISKIKDTRRQSERGGFGLGGGGTSRCGGGRGGE